MGKNEKTKIRNLMKDYRINSAFEAELRAWGLVLTKTKKHVKIARSDGKGGTVTIATSRSDHRGGKNVAPYIIRLLEA